MDREWQRQTEAGAPEADRGQPPEYSLTGDTVRSEQIRDGGVGTAPAPAGGMKRYPTEPPAGEARGGRRRAALGWSALGGAAGAGLSMLLMKLRHRRRA
jgi:hypothetical protein